MFKALKKLKMLAHILESLGRLETKAGLIYHQGMKMDNVLSQIQAVDNKVLENQLAAAMAFAALKQNILTLQQQVANLLTNSNITPEAQTALNKLLTDTVSAHDEIVEDSGLPSDPNTVPQPTDPVPVDPAPTDPNPPADPAA